MKFYMPTRVYDEDNCVERHAREWVALGSRALIVTGRRSAIANGSLADVEAALDAVGKGYVLFSEVEENPSVETVVRAAEFGKENDVDFVIGIGGGSPLDAAKAIALLIKHPEADAAYLYNKGVDGSTVPIVAIPTTCGTGSEVTAISVLTRHDLKTKQSIPFRIFPDIALIDGKYIEAAPMTMIRSTAVDALAHLMESYINSARDDYSAMAVQAGLSVWRRSRDVLLGKKQADKEDYRNLMRAATLAGMAIAQTGTSIPHALSYILTYDAGLSHGRAVGRFLPGFLREATESDRQQVLSWAGYQDVDELATDLEVMLGVPEVSEETMARTFKFVIGAPDKLGTAPFTVDEEVLRRIVE